MDHRLRLVFRKASTQTQPTSLQRSAGRVVPLPGLIDYTDWQNANDVREDTDRISPGSHFDCSRCLLWSAGPSGSEIRCLNMVGRD